MHFKFIDIFYFLRIVLLYYGQVRVVQQSRLHTTPHSLLCSSPHVTALQIMPHNPNNFNV